QRILRRKRQSDIPDTKDCHDGSHNPRPATFSLCPYSLLRLSGRGLVTYQRQHGGALRWSFNWLVVSSRWLRLTAGSNRRRVVRSWLGVLGSIVGMSIVKLRELVQHARLWI